MPTRFEVAGTTLTQVIDHKGADFVYPIVADPWFGIDLYGQPWVTTYVGQTWKVNVVPTSWGLQYNSPAIWWAHRDEVVTKLGSNAWRWANTIQEQFYCHIGGGVFALPVYNLESWRPFVGWAVSLVQYRCNPYDGGWS